MKALIWLEIRTKDFIRAIDFYENILDISMEIKHLYEKRVALFPKDDFGINGCIIDSEENYSKNSVVLFLKVPQIGLTLVKVDKFGGKVVTKPFLVKQKDMDGKEIIGKNLFDDDVGYLSEINDPDGNTVYIYARS